jgi:type IX secretion system PorP/SprF family membrane protein
LKRFYFLFLHHFLHRIKLVFSIFIVFVEIIDVCKVSAQDPVFSQFMFNQLHFNPAFAGNLSYPRFMAGYRNQWPEIGNVYVSYYASYDQFVEWLDGGLGINVGRDIQGKGAFSKSWADLIYSHPFKLSKEVLVSLGIQASIIQKKIGGTGLVFPDQNPYQNSTGQEYVPDQGKVYPDFSAGTSFFIKEQYQINFSVHHLNTPNEMIGSGGKFFSPLLYTAQILGRLSTQGNNRNDNNWVFQPGVMAQIQNNNVFFGWGSNVLYSSFTGGLWFRNNLSFNVNSFVFMAGYSYSGLSLVYSYDLWAPKNDQGLKIYSAHEVTFIYLFQYNDPKKKMRMVKCPKFY